MQMNIKKISKYLVVAMLLTVGITLTWPKGVLIAQARHAQDAGIPGGNSSNSNSGKSLGSQTNTSSSSSMDTNGTSSGNTTTGTGHGGASKYKTGFFVTVTYADSENGTPHLLGRGAVLKCQGGQGVPGSIGANVGSQSRIPGATVGYRDTAPWPFLAFDTDKGVGYGTAVKNFLASEAADGSKEALEVAQKFCDVKPSEITDLLGQNKVVFLNVEPICWHNKFSSSSPSSNTGALVGGLTYGIGSALGDAKTFTITVDRKAFPKAFRYDKNWQQISTCADMNLYPAATMTNKSVGCGIVSVKMGDSYQLVIACENDDGTFVTEYSGCGAKYNIQQVYEGYTFVEGTFSNKKTPLTDETAPYSSVVASGEPTRGVSVGEVTFQNQEKALFLHYKGSFAQPPKDSNAHLYSWETAYPMPRYEAKREDGANVNNGYCLADYIEQKIHQVKSKKKGCSDDTPEVDAGESECVIDNIIFNGVDYGTGDGWRTAKYSIAADLGAFSHASWNLYRPDVAQQATQWKTYAQAIGPKVWQVDKVVDPQFSYYLTRSQLEDVTVSKDRNDGGVNGVTTSLNKAGVVTWKQDYTGVIGKEQKPNTEGTHDVSTYNYKYTAVFTLTIKYHFKHEEKTKQYSKANPSDPNNPITWTETHPAHHHYGDGEYTTSNYSPGPWNGSTGSSHKEDKYKVKKTGNGFNTNAGNVVAEVKGSEFKGKWAKTGEEFDMTPTKEQLVGSQFQGTTFKIYPEVAMSVWVCGSGSSVEKYTKPTEQLTFVMGEYARTYIPPIAHSYITGIEGASQMEGIGSLASAATGKATTGISSYDLGVTAMGTTFEVGTKTKYKVDIYTVGCTVNTDGEGGAANSAWGNSATDVKGSHQEYVDSVLAGLNQELIMKLSSSKFQHPIYYQLLTTEGDTKIQNLAEEKTNIYWKMGNATELGTVQGWCNTMWPASSGLAYNEALQYTESKILNTMFINATDPITDNNSDKYATRKRCGNSGSGSSYLAGHDNHWYDEESKNKMKVEFYHTRIIFGCMTADDKIDYNLLEQHANNFRGENDSIKVEFYSRMYNLNNFTAADGYTWPNTGTYRVDKVKGTDFSVVNQTTSQMKN